MTFSPERSDAIRDGLISEVDRGVRRRGIARRLLAGAALVTAGLLVGGAVSAFALAGRTVPAAVIDQDGVPAPPGVTPGAPIISLLGDAVSQKVDGTAEIPLPAIPTGATHLRITVTCLTVGVTSWGLDPVNNPSSGCGVTDLDGAKDNSAWFDFELGAKEPTIYIGANPGVQSIVVYQFLNYVPTAWGVTANGKTFGVSKPDGTAPDLVSVAGIDADGKGVEGYSYGAELNGFGPDWPRMPNNPTEALKWQAERDAKYPNGWDIPVYAPDGTTRVGTFHIGSGH